MDKAEFLSKRHPSPALAGAAPVRVNQHVRLAPLPALAGAANTRFRFLISHSSFLIPHSSFLIPN